MTWGVVDSPTGHTTDPIGVSDRQVSPGLSKQVASASHAQRVRTHRTDPFPGDAETRNGLPVLSPAVTPHLVMPDVGMCPESPLDIPAG